MRDKAKEDPTFRERLLDYIMQVVEECMPEEPLMDEDDDDAHLFQPYTHPDERNFDRVMRQNLSTIVRYRQMHCRTHMPTCFKYRSKKCRSRFPRAIVSETCLDEDTGVILVKRDHHWVNNYHKWIAQMTRANHDIQFLFTKNHALATIHYVMKYITKADVALHSKLTIAAAMRKALTAPSSTDDMGKKMLLKIYNKMESYREVGVPEAITHMLDYPDHYTDAIFGNLHTTHLLAYMRRLHGQPRTSHDAANSRPDSDIVVNDRGGFRWCPCSMITLTAAKSSPNIVSMTTVVSSTRTKGRAASRMNLITLNVRAIVKSFAGPPSRSPRCWENYCF